MIDKPDFVMYGTMNIRSWIMADFKYEIIEHIGVISTSRKGWMKDVSWISLGMYIAFVIGVFLWIIHGINTMSSAPIPSRWFLRRRFSVTR